MAKTNRKVEKKRIWATNIEKYRKMFGLTQGQLADFMGYSGYTTVAMAEKPSERSIGVNKIQEYIDAFRKLSEKETEGKQVLRLTYDDMIYIMDDLDE